MPGECLSSIGALALAWFVVRLWVAPTPAPLFGGEPRKAGP